MFDPNDYMITVAEMPSARKALDSVLTEGEKDQFIDWLSMNPDCGDIIQGTNGVRKTRWSYGAKGKSGGLRIIYYFRDLNMPIYIIAVYKKNEKMNITDAEKKAIRLMIDELVVIYAEKRNKIAAKSVG